MTRRTNTATEFGQAIAATVLLGDYHLWDEIWEGDDNFRVLWYALEREGGLRKGAKYASARRAASAMFQSRNAFDNEALERMTLLYGVKVWTGEEPVHISECLRWLTPVEVPGPDLAAPEDTEDVEGFSMIASSNWSVFRVQSNCSTHRRERNEGRGWFAHRRGAIDMYSSRSKALKAVIAARAEANRVVQAELWAKYVAALLDEG